LTPPPAPRPNARLTPASKDNVRGHSVPVASTVHGVAPGLAVTVAVALVATVLGKTAPLIGGPVFGILLGVLIAWPLGLRPALRPGLAVASKPVLHASIVLLGTGLSLSEVLRVGTGSLPVMLGTLTVALAGAWFFGRMLQVDAQTSTLIGVGTGICGASAIAAVTAVIDAAESKVAYAIGTIFTFNIVSVLLYPSLGHMLNMSEHAFGLWSGTAINDTSSVVAAAYSYGSSAGDYAVVVKLTRSLMIIPICIALAAFQARRASRKVDEPRSTMAWRKMFPLFIVGFLVASALNTVGAIPRGWHSSLTSGSIFLITVALSGIGLSTRLASLRAAGRRPLLLGAILWMCVGLSSVLLQAATHQV
jgi:uncharacterized integral membrane protein (TIGR00698 family)